MYNLKIALLVFISGVSHIPALNANTRLDGVIPPLIYTPKLIILGESTTKTQTELDEELIKQVRSDKYLQYLDFGNYHKVSKIIAQGAFISNEALFASIKGRYKHSETGLDFKSFQLMYLNGEFEPSVFEQLSCTELKKAINPSIVKRNANKKNIHTTAEQIAIFLSGKVNFTRCKRIFNDTIGSRLSEINLNVAKILLNQGVNTDDAINEALRHVTWKEEHSFDFKSAEENYKNNLLIRYRVIEFLIEEGVKPTPIDLQLNFQYYIKTLRANNSIYSQTVRYELFAKITKLFVSLGITLDKKSEVLLAEYREIIYNKRSESSELKESSSTSYYKKTISALDYSVSLYPKVIRLFESQSIPNIETTIVENDLTKQLYDSVIKKDNRRASFYLKKGAQATLSTLRIATINNMDNVAIKIMDQKLDFDSYIIASLAIENKSPELVTHLINKGKISGEASIQLIVEASNRKYTSLVESLIKYGADSEKALTLSIEKYGSEYQSEIIARAGNDESKAKLAKLKAKELRQSKIAKQNAEKARKAKEKKAQQKLKHEMGLYLAKKSIGDMVCKDGRMAIFLRVTIKGYVEASSSNKIRVRIADTGGTSPYYNGVSLHQNTIIWDDFQEWKQCSF